MNNPIETKQLDTQAVLNKIVLEFMKDRKRKQISRWIFRGLLLVVLIFSFYFIFSDLSGEKKLKPHIGLLDLSGEIAEQKEASAENFIKGLQEAYRSKGLKALILRINSPGGSPVQADYMYTAINHYRKIFPSVKVYAVCTDLCASAAYYVASATDAIYANESSLVGSIGVIYNGFGFVDAMQKLGVTRRLQTAGINKGFLDPFSPEVANQKEILQGMLSEIHQVFINKVKQGRGARLKIDEQTFSGLFWTGTTAKERGLIDGFASTWQVAREIIGLKEITDYTYKQSFADRLSKQIGTEIVNQLPEALGLKVGVKI